MGFGQRNYMYRGQQDYSVRADSQDWNVLVCSPLQEDAIGNTANTTAFQYKDLPVYEDLDYGPPKVAEIAFQPADKPVGSQGDEIPPPLTPLYKYYWAFEQNIPVPDVVAAQLGKAPGQVVFTVSLAIKMPSSRTQVFDTVLDATTFIAGAVVAKLRGRQTGTWLLYTGSVIGSYLLKKGEKPLLTWKVNGTCDTYWKATGTFLGVSYDLTANTTWLQIAPTHYALPLLPTPAPHLEDPDEIADWWEFVELSDQDT